MQELDYQSFKKRYYLQNPIEAAHEYILIQARDMMECKDVHICFDKYHNL